VDDPTRGKTKSKSASSKIKKLPLCRRYLIRLGQWLPAVNVTAPPYKTSVQHLRCYPSEEYTTTTTGKSRWTHTYKWVPDAAFVGECAFDDYRADDLCALLPRATIAIVGDSLSWEQYRSLISLHHTLTRQGYQQQSYELHQNIQQAICADGLTTVVYRRDDHLLNLADAIRQNFPTVLILNRGAHYVTDDELKRDLVGIIQTVKEWLKTCEKKYQMECHFFWRTSVPGHIGCNETSSSSSDITTTAKSNAKITARRIPHNNLADMEAWVENKSNYNSVSIDYHWHDFRRQNELVLKEFKKAELSNFQVIDAYHLNILRPDEHRTHQGDCLHSCFPGKMDVYNQLLLHFLKMQRSPNDVRRTINVAKKYDWPTNVESTKYESEKTLRAHDKRLAAEAQQLAQATAAGAETTSTSRDNTDDDTEQGDDDGAEA
jgi:GDSL/SGNH-like Acyl-Esterase family found in Pmr5 and Cas1p